MPCIITGQNPGYYYMYPQDRFLMTHTMDKTNYLRSLHKELCFPKEDSGQFKEGLVKIVMINHGKAKQELLPANEPSERSAAAIKAIEKSNELYLKPSHEPYMTEIHFYFDLEPLDVKKDADIISVTRLNGISCGPAN